MNDCDRCKKVVRKEEERRKVLDVEGVWVIVGGKGSLTESVLLPDGW